MKKQLLIIIFTCAWVYAQAQVNFVKNSSFEDTIKCPDEINQLGRAKYWTCAVDTAGNIDGLQYYAPEYLNSCAGTTWPIRCGVPENGYSIQFPRTGNAYIGSLLYYDKTPPSPPFVSDSIRDYAQGRLYKNLEAGKTYCMSYWVVLGETSHYTHDNIGAYLDNGNINKRSPAGIEITDVIPQVSSTSIIKDTMNWVKVEGSFTAIGNETHITLGNFAKQADVDTESVPYYAALEQYSYYLIDDVSVIPLDLTADAGKDTWVEMGKQIQIGRVGDTTAEGLDCKWYRKGLLIDSGAVITVNANAVKNAVDTYVVVQTICGLVKTDTVTVKTAGVGIPLLGGARGGFNVYPNPSNGTFIISSPHAVIPRNEVTLNATVYDLLGRVVQQEELLFNNKEASLNLNLPNATYILEMKDEGGNVQRERIVIE